MDEMNDILNCTFLQEIICPLDEVGRFTDPVSDFKGQYVKDADKNIVKKLKEDGRLLNASQVRREICDNACCIF